LAAAEIRKPREVFILTEVTFRKGPKKRNELRLPVLHYVVADDWIQKLGEKAFCAWLRFHTWVDRRENEGVDKVPYTMEDVAKKLGVSKATLYRTIIRPLWEYGLIDLVEYESTNRKTQKPVNIIVYESPKNEHETKVMPLVKLRDWKDYGSSAQIYGLKGGRPKTRGKQDPSNNPETKNDNTDRFNNETVHGFKNETVTDSKMKPNNDTNKHTHDQNKHTHDSNNHHHQEEDQKVVVVSEKDIHLAQAHIKYLFDAELDRDQIVRLIRICIQNGKEIGQVIENTYYHFIEKKEPINDLMSALVYGAKKGWELSKKVKVSPTLDFGSETKSEYRPYNWVDALVGDG